MKSGAVELGAWGQGEEMNENMDERQNPEEVPVEPVTALSFEGIPVTGVEGVIPSIPLEMPDGYPIGTHLRFEVEVRVANVRYEEGKGRKKGDFIRKHIFATEAVTLTDAFVPGEGATAPMGSAAGSEGLLEPEEASSTAPVVEEAYDQDPAFERLIISFRSDPVERGEVMDALLTSMDGETVESELPVLGNVELTAKNVCSLADETGVTAILVDVSDPQGDLLMEELRRAISEGSWSPLVRAMQLVPYAVQAS